MLFKSLLLSLLIISNLSFASVASKYQIFKNIGKFSKIDFKPQNSPSEFKYDVFYYVPKSISNQSGLNTLVFMHGGGASTTTRAGSDRAINMYKNDLMSLADKLGFVLIMPSGSGVNWGSHLISYFKDLNEILRKDLPINPNKIALAGHSMGAMGITRSAPWLTDEYAFFMPIAGGIQDQYNVNKYLKTYFNTAYYHMQGLSDHFQIFVERCKKQKSNVEALESKMRKDSGFTMEFYKGSHNYDRPLLELRLKEMFTQKSRNLYQTQLHGLFYDRDEVRTDQWSNGNEYYLGTRNRYFWLQATEFYQDKEVIEVEAKSIKNTITINIEEGVKTLRVYLSKKMIDLNKEVKIFVNNIEVYNAKAILREDTAQVKKDASFKFESYVDIQL